MDLVPRVPVESDGVVPAEKDEDGHQTVPGQFYDDVGDHENFPAVGLRRSLPYFVKIPLYDEMRHHLFHHLPENGEQQEDTEELILKGLNGCAGVVERETDEKSRRHAEHGLGPNVRSTTAGTPGEVLPEAEHQRELQTLYG